MTGRSDMRAVTRQALADEAMTWLGTPYRHQASLKGIGCDCLGLVRGVWRHFYGPEPEPLTAYSPDWAEARGEETLAAVGFRNLVPTTIDDADTGDILLFRWRASLPAKHAAILIAKDRMIHAHQDAAVATATVSSWWRRRIAFAFSFPGIEAP